MKILIVTQYFWPENFRINDLCLGLKERGHDLTILTGKPNYPKGVFYQGYTTFNKSFENWNGIAIYRAPLVPRGKGGGKRLFLNYISFAFFCSLKVLLIKGNFDKIFVYEPSPITIGIPAIIAKMKFKAPIYFWVQDLWPASISAAGGLNNKYIIGLMNAITRLIYYHSKKILVQSRGFMPYILNQNVSIDKLVYYPNSTENYYQVLPAENRYINMLPKGLSIMFAGNIGESQSFDTLIDAAYFLKENSIKLNWIILGDGRMKESVKKRITELKLEDTFYLLGSFPSTEMPKFFGCTDALIVSLKKDPIFALTIPSKVQSYMACGKPIIASLDGEGANVILKAKAGFVSPAEDYLALAENIIQFKNLTVNEKKVLGQNSRSFFEKEFERELLLNNLESILQS
jgi:glycosyltransferase involved in cell wall biosynthesis